MTTDRTLSTRQRFTLQLSLMGVLAIWGLAVLTLGITGAIAQDQPADDGSGDAAAADDNGGGPATAQVRIAYINLEKVIKEYPRWWKKFEQLKAKSEAKEKELKERERKLKLAKREIESGKDVSRERFEEYAREARMFELETRRVKAELEQDIRDLSTAVYEDTYKMVETVTGGKYDLVLGVNERQIRTGTQGEFFQKMTVRAVLVYDEGAELTDGISLRLQAKAVKDGIVTLDELNEHRSKLGQNPVKWDGDTLVADESADDNGGDDGGNDGGND